MKALLQPHCVLHCYMFSIHSSDDNHQPITLDFTEHEPIIIGKSIKRHLLIINRTAIPAPFTVEAEYFTGYGPSQSDENSKRYSTYCIIHTDSA